jgi:hypothetical protein
LHEGFFVSLEAAAYDGESQWSLAGISAGSVRFAVAKMNLLGIALIVIGVALVCGGLILWPRSRTEGDDHGADGVGLADLVQRLNESSDEDPLK